MDGWMDGWLCLMLPLLAPVCAEIRLRGLHTPSLQCGAMVGVGQTSGTRIKQIPEIAWLGI
jgi:hypothetical protein